MSGTLLITGGSRGIGAATARMAAAHGYDVAINFRSAGDAAERVAADVQDAGQQACIVQGNVADEADVRRLFETVDRELGRLTALVNNAGTVGPVCRVEDLGVEALRSVFELNVVGSFLCAREAVRRMSTRHGGEGGAIVNLSSIAARIGNPNVWVHYAASKGAIDSFTIGLAKEVGPDGIRVNAVAPGLIDTEIHAPLGGSDRYPAIAAETPLGRIGRPEDVAEAIL
ncbi:MAG: SDR family oxidoreductase, partial [Geminicoccaceae bacterium]|nr:SDR family oxidoreductase [Geminicoccaceae bacterium]